MIVNLRATVTSRKANVAKGIQKWLYGRGFCISEKFPDQVDARIYRETLMEFCLTQEGFVRDRAKSLEALEGFIDRRFLNFCHFCIAKFKAR